MTARDRFVVEMSAEGGFWVLRVRGTSWWTQVRSREDVEEMARDLIALNAERSSTHDFDVEIAG